MVTPAPDEMLDAAGGFRPHWRPLLGTVVALGWDALRERAGRLDEALIAEDGAGPGGAAPARRCDLIPLILDPAEFATLESGLAQRAAAIEALLRDVYGPQRLLAGGLLPPALVFANPAFLRPCRRADGGAPDAPLLHAYAADLLRGPDGAWRVVADRTATPGGLAQAVENRDLLARIVPEFFAAPRALRPLRPFLDLWQDALQRLVPAAGGAVALLSPGPHGRDWAEHVLLARGLSCALVEGGDLTVRGGALYLKTLRGLSRVGVLLRRQDGRTVDPLELDPDTRAGGVTGLLDAARGGAVRVANDPGTGMAEAPAVASVLPALAPRLIGEALRLPQAETLWLGDPAARDRALGGDLSPWLVRRALDGTQGSVRAAALPAAARAALAARLRAAPEAWALSAAFAPSLAPSADPAGGRMVPRPVLLRMFLVHDGAGWRALPGGLARVPGEAADGAPLTKDVWVPAADGDGAASTGAAAAAPVAAVPIRRPSGDLPSRVADDFYWLGRYLERLESAARLLRGAAARLQRPDPTPREAAELAALARCLVRADLLHADAARGLGAGRTAEALLRALREGGGGAGPLGAQLARLGRVSAELRDHLGGEMRAALGAAGLRPLADRVREAVAAPPAPAAGPADAAAALRRLAAAADAILAFAASIAGLAAENMVRGGGRLFLDLGRRVERAQSVAAWVARALDEPGAGLQPARLEPGLRLALELCDSVIAYRNRYHTVLQPAPVLDLILADEGNPRGLAFQLAAARDTLRDLAEGEPARRDLADGAAALLAEARAMVESIAAAPAQAEAAIRLPPRLTALEGAVAALSDRVAGRYFALLPAARSLGLEPAPDRAAAGTTAALEGVA